MKKHNQAREFSFSKNYENIGENKMNKKGAIHPTFNQYYHVCLYI